MEKMKQNKNTSVVIRVSCFSLALIVLFCSIAIPVSAEALNNKDFSTQPIPVVTSGRYADYWEQGLKLSTGTGAVGIASKSNPNVYVFGYKVDNTLGLCFVSEESFQAIVCSGTSSSSAKNYASSNPNSTYNNLFVSYSKYLSTVISDWSPYNIPCYDTIEEGIEAFTGNVINGGGTVAEFNYSIKPGYALFIDIHGLNDVSGTLFTNTSAAYASPHTSNQTLSYQSALPSGNVSPQGNGINWQGTGNRDLFGRYKSWNRSLIIQPNANYIAIYNPVHINTYVDPEHEDFNGNISVHVNKAYSDTSILIPLNTELTGTGTVGTNTTEEQKPIVYDENTNTWVPQNGDGTPYTESPYGDYMPSTTNSIHDWLQNIANLISGFFNGAIGAVTTLVGAGSAFINQLVSLYSWLPAPVYAVLSSALILVITIGVIKVFI